MKRGINNTKSYAFTLEELVKIKYDRHTVKTNTVTQELLWNLLEATEHTQGRGVFIQLH